MGQLLVLGVSGLCLGAGLSAARHRAPRALMLAWYVLGGIGLALSWVLLGG